MSEFVRSETAGRTGIVTIDRPDRLHALGADVLEGLDEAFGSLEDATVVRLRTTGDRAFVSGADMKEFDGMTKAEFVAFLDLQRGVNDRIESHPAMVVAEVDGIAYGGGFELALATDLVVAAESAEFAFPEVSNGWIPGGGGTQRLPRVVGVPKAKELLATARPVSAADAASLGVVNRVVPDGEVGEAAEALAAELGENAPLAVRSVKRLCDEGVEASIDAALSYEQAVMCDLFDTDDAEEGLEAFREKRDPEFRGR